MKSTDAVEITIDLRAVRAASERAGDLATHTTMTTDLSAEVRRILSAGTAPSDSAVSIIPMANSGHATKAGLQVVDAILILMAPIGLRGLAALVVEIVKACQKKLPNEYVLKSGETEIRISGPDVKAEDLRELRRALDATALPPGPGTRARKTAITIIARPEPRK